MKTNVIMTRQLGDLEVFQRTKDGMFNATALLNQWNNKNLKKKSIADFFRLNQTKEFIDILIQEEKSHFGNSQNGDFQPFIVIKGKFTSTGKMPDIVWMHPYLFIKFAMWLNSHFEYKVLKFVYDSLIELRKETSDLYLELCNATNNYFIRNNKCEAPISQYKGNATMIQELVFGKTFLGNPWQDANENQLKLRKQLESVLIGCYNKNIEAEKIIFLLESQVELFNISKN